MNIISSNRFKQIRKVFPFAFHDKQAMERGDPWYPLMGMINGFNNSRKTYVAASAIKTLDESMSGWKPRTTALGDLPNISFVIRKPVPLGTEFKNIACTATKIMLYLEVQRGKLPMKELKYYSEYGTTTSCVLRLADETEYSGKCASREEARVERKKEIYYGDSWFASLKTAEAMALRGHEFGGPVSTTTLSLILPFCHSFNIFYLTHPCN